MGFTLPSVADVLERTVAAKQQTPVTGPAMNRVQQIVGAITQGGIKMPASAAGSLQRGMLAGGKTQRFITQPKTTEPGRRPIATTSPRERAYSNTSKMVRAWIAAHPQEAGTPDQYGRYLNVPIYRDETHGYWQGYLEDPQTGRVIPITPRVFPEFPHNA